MKQRFNTGWKSLQVVSAAMSALLISGERAETLAGQQDAEMSASSKIYNVDDPRGTCIPRPFRAQNFSKLALQGKERLLKSLFLIVYLYFEHLATENQDGEP